MRNFRERVSFFIFSMSLVVIPQGASGVIISESERNYCSGTRTQEYRYFVGNPPQEIVGTATTTYFKVPSSRGPGCYRCGMTTTPPGETRVTPNAWCFPRGGYQPPAPEPEPSLSIPSRQCGSIILAEEQVLMEVVEVSGVPFSLLYSSRYTGRKADYSLKIPLTSDLIHPSLETVHLSTEVLGQTDQESFSGATNLESKYLWPGWRENGEAPPNGTLEIEITISETYSTEVFQTPIVWERKIGGYVSKHIGLGNWQPSIMHYYDTKRERLSKGDGEVQNVGYVESDGLLRVADESAKQVYYFDLNGRHLYTRSWWNGGLLFEFVYNGSGQIQSISNGEGVKTDFNRMPDGRLEISSHYGKKTLLEFNSEEQLTSITGPDGGVYSMTYQEADLLETFTKPEGQVSTFRFDDNGLLLSDENSSSYRITLESILGANQQRRTINQTTAEGRQTKYELETFSSVDQTSYSTNVTLPYGGRRFTSSTVTEDGYDTTVSNADFSNTRVAGQGTSRFGEPLPVYFWDNRAGKSRFSQVSRTVSYLGPAPFEIQEHSTVTVTNDKPQTTIYSGVTNTISNISPEGRRSLSTIDEYDRTSKVQVGSYFPLQIGYDGLGKINELAQGDRKLSFTYNAAGEIETMTNPVGEVTSFEYDDYGRVSLQIQPNGKEVGFGYDKNGNLVSVTPSDRPEHSLSMNAYELLGVYSPPDLLANSVNDTTWEYNSDKQLTNVTTPDGRFANYNYGAASGLLESIETASGQFYYSYGEGARISEGQSPDGVVFNDSYTSGAISLHAMRTPFSADLAYSYNDDILLDSMSINQNAEEQERITFEYDDDELVIKAGDLLIDYESDVAALQGTQLGTVSESYQYNDYGETKRYVASSASEDLFSVNYERDNLGRIIQKDETIQGQTTRYIYHYDSIGQLKKVEKYGL